MKMVPRRKSRKYVYLMKDGSFFTKVVPHEQSILTERVRRRCSLLILVSGARYRGLHVKRHSIKECQEL